MALFIGIDLGTSAMKLLLMDENGVIHNTVTEEYPLEFPKAGWSQQNPEDWKKALFAGLPSFQRIAGRITWSFSSSTTSPCI